MYAPKSPFPFPLGHSSPPAFAVEFQTRTGFYILHSVLFVRYAPAPSPGRWTPGADNIRREPAAKVGPNPADDGGLLQSSRIKVGQR